MRGLAGSGRWLILAGLVGGLAFPDRAGALSPFVGHFVIALFAIASLRAGPEAIERVRTLGPATLRATGILQLALPLVALAVLAVIGLQNTAAALAVIVALTAPPIMSSPNLAMMVGARPEPALRLLVAGTLVLPVSAPLILWSLLGGAHAAMILAAALRLFALVGGVLAGAMAVRRWIWKSPGEFGMAALDAASVLAMAGFVAGLMPEVRSTMASAPVALFGWLLLAFGLNYGGQLAVRRYWPGASTGFAIAAGNRNTSVFLVALPQEIMAPVLAFIACYQIPMFLTPLLLRRFYVRMGHEPGRAWDT